MGFLPQLTECHGSALLRWLTGQYFAYTEEFASHLPPAELLGRFAGRTALAATSELAGQPTTSASYGSQHWFAGQVTADGHFTLLELLKPSGNRGWFWQVTGQPLPRLEGQVSVTPGGSPGSRLRLSYQRRPYSWPVCLLLATLAGLATWLRSSPWPLALLVAAVATPLLRLAQWVSFRAEAENWRNRLVEVTPLRLCGGPAYAAASADAYSVRPL